MVQLLQKGSVSQNYRYDAYGYINADEFGIQAPFYGYNGEEQNPFTGLQYLRARYYAPQNGGFVTQDSFFGTLTDALTQNQYTYAGNNPVNFIDPSGHSFAFLGAEGGGSSAKKVGTKTSSAVKKTTANSVASKAGKATTSSKESIYGKSSGGYANGAAAAAHSSYSSAGAGGISGYGQKVTKTVANSPRVVKQNAKGVWQELPQHFGNVVEASKEFIRKMCDAETQRIEAQRAVDQAQQKALTGVMDTVGNWWKENGATFMRGVGVTVIGALAVTTAIAALPAVALFGTAGAIVTFGTLAVGTFTTTMGVQDMAAAVIPYQPLKDIVNSPTYTAIENVATAGSMIGTGMTSPIAAMGQMISKGATQQAAQQNPGTTHKGDEASSYEGADVPMGSRYNQMNQPKNPAYQPVRNTPTIVGEREFSGHALDRMQDRGIMPSVVENTINSGAATPSYGGTTQYYDPINNISVVINENGKVVTVTYGK